MVLCTDGVWSAMSQSDMATWLTSAPILTAAPKMMDQAEERGGSDGDNLSTIIVRWGPETLTDETQTTITDTLGMGEFATEIDKTMTLSERRGSQRDLTDDEIERAISEIQSTIQKYRK
jgi:serine/threonine protein phosphatase PrpC